jgi:chromosome segregation ATPase
VTLSDESEEEAPESEKFLAFVSPHVEEEDSYYSEHSENEEELKEAYKTLYIEYEKLREGRKQYLNDLNSLQTEKSSLLLKVQELEEKLLETQLQLERVTDEKLTRMLSIQKSPNDKTGLGYVAPSSDIPSSSKTVFVNLQSQSLLPLLKIKRRKRSTMMFQAFRSLIPSEDLPFAITAVSVGMFALSALS